MKDYTGSVLLFGPTLVRGEEEVTDLHTTLVEPDRPSHVQDLGPMQPRHTGTRSVEEVVVHLTVVSGHRQVYCASTGHGPYTGSPGTGYDEEKNRGVGRQKVIW